MKTTETICAGQELAKLILQLVQQLISLLSLWGKLSHSFVGERSLHEWSRLGLFIKSKMKSSADGKTAMLKTGGKVSMNYIK